MTWWWLAGCGGGGDGAGFVLTVVPHALDDQDPFVGDAALWVHRPDVEPETFDLGAADGEARAEAVDPIPAGSIVGLSFADAWGGAALEDGADTVDVLVTEVGRVGRLGAFAEAQASIKGAVAVVPGGDAFVFGGVDADGADDPHTASPAIKRLSGLDAGEGASFERLDVALPAAVAWDGLELVGRVGAAAVAVQGEDEVLVLVSGGRDENNASGGNTTHTFLFDPADETVVWEGEMAESRSEHQALRLPGGDVILHSGYTRDGIAPPSWERFDPVRRRFRAGDAVAVGNVQARAAALSDADALLCGGARWDFAARWDASSVCHRLRDDLSAEVVTPLPIPLGGHAMAELPRGRVLVAGGWTGAIVDPSQSEHGTAPASDRAFVYDAGDDEWREVGGLVTARAHATAIPLADGSVLIVGGTTEGHGAFASLRDAVRCAERFDPETEAFTEVQGGCDDAGAGADPQWGGWPGEDVVIVEGWTRDGPYRGGAAYGLVGTGQP